MKLVVKCEDCGRVLGAFDKLPGVGFMDGDGVKHEFLGHEDCMAALNKQFGATDVEQLALSLYDVFHDKYTTFLPEDAEPGWEPYKKYRGDEVVSEFRRVAKLVAGEFADGHIGAVYYSKDYSEED